MFLNDQMEFLNGKLYEEVKNKRYLIHPSENKKLGLRDPPIPKRTQ